MSVSAKLVKELRDKTGAGMMDCKKALEETNGNVDEAIDVLREKGLSKAAKKADRIAAEGLVRLAFSDDRSQAVVIEVNSETDFVAKNQEFIDFVEKLAEIALTADNNNIDAFMEMPFEGEGTVNDALVQKTAKIGEKLSIRRFEKVVAENGIVVPYVHGGGRISVLVEADTDVVNDAIKDAVKNVAMQVAALNPKFISSEDISEEYRNHEKEILLAQAMKENEELPEGKRKPQEIIEKMLNGRLVKEFKEICLNEQVYVKAEDGKQSVGQYIAQVGKANNANIKIARFVRFETGEGIEKKNENFAEEVAKQAGTLN